MKDSISSLSEEAMRLCEKATSAPWTMNGGDIWDASESQMEPGVPLFRQASDSYRTWGRRVAVAELDASAALIIFARNHLPELAQAASRAAALEEEVERLKKALHEARALQEICK